MDVTFQYAAKFLCGRTDKGEVAPGSYLTAINIHNPNEVLVRFRWKVAVALPIGQSGTITTFKEVSLIEDGAVEIDCEQIRRVVTSAWPPGGAPPPFLKGFVVIESDCELDVVAVYTAMGDSQQVATLHTERVPARRREECGPRHG
jgi:hypothetical protein